MKIETRQKTVYGKIILTEEEEKALKELKNTILQVCNSQVDCGECPFEDTAICGCRELQTDIEKYNEKIEEGWWD